jgi:serine/threonine protein phosphatase PrpC
MQGWERQMKNESLCCVNIDGNNKNGNSLFVIFDGFRGIISLN